MWDYEDKALVLMVIGLALIVVLRMTVGVWQGVNIWNSELQMPDWLLKL